MFALRRQPVSIQTGGSTALATARKTRHAEVLSYVRLSRTYSSNGGPELQNSPEAISLETRCHRIGTNLRTEKTVSRHELARRIAREDRSLSAVEAERIVNAIFDEITAALRSGERVELKGFGAFSVRKRSARVGRNPRTGEPVFVEEKQVPFFKTGKLLRDRINGTSPSGDDDTDDPGPGIKTGIKR